MDWSHHQLPVSGDDNGPEREPLSWEVHALLLGKKQGVQSVLPASGVLKFLSGQNNQYAKAAYFGVACPIPLH